MFIETTRTPRGTQGHGSLANPGGLRSLELLANAWLAGFHVATTRKGYTTDLRHWFAFCETHQVHPLEVHRAVIETWQTRLLADGLGIRTAARKVSAIGSFYRYCEEEGAIGRTPMLGVRRLSIPRESPRSALTSGQVNDLAEAAKLDGPDSFALVMLLASNGLRIGETCALNVEDLSVRDGAWPVLKLRHRKGGKVGEAKLGRVTEVAVNAVAAGRGSGPLLRIARNGNRMNQKAAQVILDRCVKHVRGTPPRLTPHVLRHSWVTIALGAGVSVDQLQHDGSWSDGRMALYYAHNQNDPAKAASHAVESKIMVAA